MKSVPTRVTSHLQPKHPVGDGRRLQRKEVTALLFSKVTQSLQLKSSDFIQRLHCRYLTKRRLPNEHLSRVLPPQDGNVRSKTDNTTLDTYKLKGWGWGGGERESAL